MLAKAAFPIKKHFLSLVTIFLSNKRNDTTEEPFSIHRFVSQQTCTWLLIVLDGNQVVKYSV